MTGDANVNSEMPMHRIDPALQPNAPEVTEVGLGVDIPQSILESMVLSPLLFRTVLKVADPGYTTTTPIDKKGMSEHDDDDDNGDEKVELVRPTFAALVEQRRQQQQQQQEPANGMQRRRDAARTAPNGDKKTLLTDKERADMESLLQDTGLSPGATKFVEENWNDWSRELAFNRQSNWKEQIVKLRARAQRRLDRLEGLLQQEDEREKQK